jgi:signal transduction histidine kinase
MFMKQAILLFLLMPVALVAQNQDSINRLAIDSLRYQLEYTTDKQAELLICTGLGIFYNMTGRYDSARIYLNRALDLPNGRKSEGGRLITNLANSYGFEGRYVEALKYYMEALQVSEQLAKTKKNRDVGLANVLRTVANLAEVHYLTGNRKQALYYAERGKAMFDEELSNAGAAYMLPQILYVIGSVHLDANELERAEEAMQETCELADTLAQSLIRQHGSPQGMYMYVAYGKEGLARVALAKKKYDKALAYAAEALGYVEKHGDPSVSAKILQTFSDIYRAKGQYKESGQYAQQAMERFPAYPDVNPETSFNFAAAKLFAGDKEEAYRHFQLYADRMKANTDKQFRETMASMEIIYETEKKELRIADLERQKISYIIVGLLLVSFISIIYRQKMRRTQKERQLVVANAIFEGEKRERERFARNLHDGVNGMLSAIRIELASTDALQDLRNRIDNCIEEIRNLASGVMPVSLQRYGMKAALEDYCRSFPNVCFHFFGESKRIDEKIELVVYYSAYELVHNSVRHSGASAINVQLIQENDRLSLTVQDNGCGYVSQSGQGVGLKNLRDRITALNGKLEILSSPETGTETAIELKI